MSTNSGHISQALRPELSYILWFSQRNGSTLLCKALESTGIAGKPGEWINCGSIAGVYERYRTEDPQKLQSIIWQRGSTSNRVFGLKYGLHQPYHDQVTALLKQFPDCPVDAPAWEAWDNTFPNCRHIFLTRRNKVRQAVSWWKAIKSGEWHREKEIRSTPKVQDEAYDFDAINHLFSEAVMREAGIQEFLAQGKVIPLVVTYEDMILDMEGTVHSIMDHLNISNKHDYKIAPPFYEKLADEVSEKWVQRFRAERQAEWPNKGW